MRALVLLKVTNGGYWSVPMAAALRDRGHQVTFGLPATDGSLPDAVRAAGMDVVRAEAPLMGAGPFRQPAAVRRMRSQLRTTLRPDVVVSHLYAAALAGRAATALTDIPHVFMSPGPLYLESPPIRGVERALCRLDSHVICSSAVLYDAYARLGLPPERRSLVPYAVPPGWGDPVLGDARAESRAALGLQADGFVACCVAMFYAPKTWVHRGRGIKGHDVLLEAWGRYRDSGGTGELLVMGAGIGPGGDRYRADVVARFARLPGVRWMEGCADVRPAYRAADVSISPSLSENYGAPAEAGTMGVTSIATRVGGLPELVIDGWNGWLVPPDDPQRLADAIRSAATAGPAELTRRGERARQRCGELFDRDANAAAFADVVERVAGRG